MIELIYAAMVACLATAVEPKGIAKPRWWVAMLTINFLVMFLRNGY